jgi:CRISPR-associated endonuclease/helicase Cas3
LNSVTASSSDFIEFFRAATGSGPYAYQRALGEAAVPPAVLNVHTGAGKTQALIVSWLYARRVRKTGSRRLVYALPMRSLVEQTVDVARRIRERLALGDDELAISTLMGGVDSTERSGWRNWPERDQILIGTIDMLLSRALNRGYAESRFAWPVAFGLLNNDCRWVFDEVQLMGSARATSAQLDGLRVALGTALPCETVWASATVDRTALETVDRPELGSVLTLPDEDRAGALYERLHARKTLERLDLAQEGVGAPAAAIAQATAERHLRGALTLIVVNTVDLAQSVYRELERRLEGANIVLVHSRFRPAERRAHMERALDTPGDSGTIVVATQVVEAGVDMSAHLLVTETAPFSSIVQRLGRCNRSGKDSDAAVLWLDRGPVGDGASGRKAAAPYLPTDIDASRNALLEREGASLSPAVLEGISVPEVADDPSVLRRRDLLDLFDTTSDLSGMDIDIAPFIREDDDRTVTVLFRDLPANAGARLPDPPAPERDELVQVPIGSLGRRACWTVDHVDGEWTRRATRDVSPGATVMLRAADGGYDPAVGWDTRISRAVDPVPLTRAGAVEAIDSDPLTETGMPEELFSHLAKVADAGAELANALGLAQWREVLRGAGALHDVGKAHPVFQQTLRTAMAGESGGDEDDHRLWAKSGKRGGRHERRYFRHELASALVIWQLDGAVPPRRRDLTAYLVAAHHGKVRLSIRPAPDETRPREAARGARFALGIVDGDCLPEVQTPAGTIPTLTLDLAPMQLGADDSWTGAAVRLRDDPQLGPFRLAFLEALLRIADWRASGE